MAEVEMKYRPRIWFTQAPISAPITSCTTARVAATARVHKLVAEVIEEMGLEHDADRAFRPWAARCSPTIISTSTGSRRRTAVPPAVATAVKRLIPVRNWSLPIRATATLAAIGTGETIHACNRGENIAIIYVNNAIYGMTGGQMAPTTLLGMKTATTPDGRDPKLNGYPYKIAEMMAHSGRRDLHDAPERAYAGQRAQVRKKRSARRSRIRWHGKGFSFVEVVATCNCGLETVAGRGEPVD